MNPFGTLLVSTDFSETSESAFPLARTLAEKFSSKIVVVYVQEDVMPPFVGEYAQTSLQSILDEQKSQLAPELARYAATHVPATIPTETVVGTGVAHAEICRIARERGAGLIVMATHGRGFLGHALFGSTTERVLRRAPCPVLTVRGHGTGDPEPPALRTTVPTEGA
jgi:nucleotide-binding universal stress UspA family protein